MGPKQLPEIFSYFMEGKHKNAWQKLFIDMFIVMFNFIMDSFMLDILMMPITSFVKLIVDFTFSHIIDDHRCKFVELEESKFPVTKPLTKDFWVIHNIMLNLIIDSVHIHSIDEYHYKFSKNCGFAKPLTKNFKIVTWYNYVELD